MPLAAPVMNHTLLSLTLGSSVDVLPVGISGGVLTTRIRHNI